MHLRPTTVLAALNPEEALLSFWEMKVLEGKCFQNSPFSSTLNTKFGGYFPRSTTACCCAGHSVVAWTSALAALPLSLTL